MKITGLALSVMLGLAAFLAWGCHERQTVVVERQRPERVERRGGPVVVERPADEVIVVREAPPAVIVERQPPRPGPTHVWIDGYYVYRERHYVWERGHWEAPPRRGAAWASPRWEHEQRGYRYVPGGWR